MPRPQTVGGGGRRGDGGRGAGRHSRALLSARLLRLLEMSLRRKRHTTLASTFPFAV